MQVCNAGGLCWQGTTRGVYAEDAKAGIYACETDLFPPNESQRDAPGPLHPPRCTAGGETWRALKRGGGKRGGGQRGGLRQSWGGGVSSMTPHRDGVETEGILHADTERRLSRIRGRPRIRVHTSASADWASIRRRMQYAGYSLC